MIGMNSHTLPSSALCNWQEEHDVDEELTEVYLIEKVYY
jgi:hypothetical protein